MSRYKKMKMMDLRMKKLQIAIFAAPLLLFAFSAASFADTFTHRKTNEVLHGYATSRTEGGKTIVHTQEKGKVNLNLAEYDITADRLGRNNKVIVIVFDVPVMLEIETAAFEQVMAEAADEGPLFILLEMDIPGGRLDFTQRICAAITKTRNCQVVTFIKGGEHGGAISAGVAVALACDKIYMAGNAAIGGAMGIAFDRTGQPQDFKKAFGEDVGEKFTSIWRANLAALAQQNHRPPILARAMVDKDIEVIEVSEAGRKFFIEPVNKTTQQRLVRTWSKKGSLVTLTAAEAAGCMIADKVVSSRQELIRDLDAAGAEIVTNDCIQQAGKDFEKARLRFNRLRKSLDLKVKRMEQTETRSRAMSIVRGIKADYKALILLAKHYPDLQINPLALEAELNSVEAFYQKHKRRK